MVEQVNGRSTAESLGAPPPIGEKMPDGTVYAGISPDTERPMYAMPIDAPLLLKWEEAKNYAAALDAHGHKDWRLPTRGELGVLFNNRAAISGFYETGPASWYWSSTENAAFDDCASSQRFCEGHRPYGHLKRFPSSLRVVRT